MPGKHCQQAIMALTLVLGAAIPRGGSAASEQDGSGPTQIKHCQVINKPGSYTLVSNLSAVGDCLVVSTEGVSIDLAGFALMGDGTGTAIKGPKLSSAAIPGIRTVVRNGDISHFARAIDIAGTVERVVVTSNHDGIMVSVGTVRGNTVQSNSETGIGITDGLVANNVVIANGTGISVSEAAVITGNEVSGNRIGIDASGIGSVVTVNVLGGNSEIGVRIRCPSNLTNNSVVGSATNVVLIDSGCHESDNVNP
jgi:hypothetical protein